MKKIIYDIGANNGDDVEYYLMKSDLVIAVEANPSLCTRIRERFKTAIETGILVVENYIIAIQPTAKNMAFYIHKKHHVLSQFPEPNEESITNFSRLYIPAITPMELLNRHGNPYYIKIDIEHYDAKILRCLFENNIFPDYISAESQSAEILCLLVALGGYNSFKTVTGSTVSKKYRKVPIVKLNGQTQIYSFPQHSAGPFAEDIHGNWLSGNGLIRKLGAHGLGWIDIHATRKSVEVSDFTTTQALAILSKKFFELVVTRVKIRSRLKRALNK